MEPVRSSISTFEICDIPSSRCSRYVSSVLNRPQSVLFNLKTKQPSGAAGAVSFEVTRATMEQLSNDLAAIEAAVLQSSK
jgi:hypothetical protein